MEQRRVGGLVILVPRGYGEDGGPQEIGECYMCGTKFFEPESRRKVERHMGKCARAHLQQQQDAKLESKLPVFASWDPEVEDHMRKVGDRMLREGRLVVKPSERAGFS